MLSERLRLALDRGLLTLPDTGRIGIFGARSTETLGALPKDRTEIVARHFPVHDHFASLGYTTSVAASGPYALTVVSLPRAKDEARQMLAQAKASSAGVVIVDGQKTDGIDAILKELRSKVIVGEALSKSHGKIAVIEAGELSDWDSPGGHQLDERFQTAPGVFSADGIDPGSALLADALPQSLKGRVVDLGAGWGYLAHAVLQRKNVTGIDLVEADHVALELARRNIDDSRATFHWADATVFTPLDLADHVVSNPPFHTSRSPDASLGQAFIRQAARILKPRGTLWLVANRHLPYEAVLKDVFSEVRVIGETSGYKLFQATNPRRPRKG